MSKLRQRSKNLIMSGLIGFLSGFIVVLLIYLFGIRGNIDVIEWILKDSQLEVMTIKEPLFIQEVAKQKVVTLNQPLKRNAVITEKNVTWLEMEAQAIPQNAIFDIQDVINKKTLIDLDSQTILTMSMVEEITVYPISYETIEIHKVHYPDILTIGQIINLRIHYPTGQDYTVIENKDVVHINEESQTFFISLTEEEILAYSSAKEDANIYPGTELYVTIEKPGTIDINTLSLGSEVKEVFEKSLIYETYPLNPNALALSKLKNYDIKLLEARVILDQSLTDFFDLNSERFNYVLEERVMEESSEDQTAYKDGEEKNENQNQENLSDEVVPLENVTQEKVSTENHLREKESDSDTSVTSDANEVKDENKSEDPVFDF